MDIQSEEATLDKIEKGNSTVNFEQKKDSNKTVLEINIKSIDDKGDLFLTFSERIYMPPNAPEGYVPNMSIINFFISKYDVDSGNYSEF